MRLFLVFIFVLVSFNLSASDLIREHRIAEQLVDSIMDGEVVEMNDGTNDFIGIYTEATTKQTRGSVVLLHGQGANPDWIDVINPLRISLPDHGWDTLSIQLPVASVDARASDWDGIIQEGVPRIEAAIDFLKKKFRLNNVIVSHSMGSLMAFEYFNKKERPIAAFASIGTPPSPVVLEALKKMNLPVLDLFGSQDLPGVKFAAKKRLAASRKSENIIFSQVEIEGADHFFNGLDEILIARIRNWIERYASGMEIGGDSAR